MGCYWFCFVLFCFVFVCLFVCLLLNSTPRARYKKVCDETCSTTQSYLWGTSLKKIEQTESLYMNLLGLPKRGYQTYQLTQQFLKKEGRKEMFI